MMTCTGYGISCSPIGGIIMLDNRPGFLHLYWDGVCGSWKIEIEFESRNHLLACSDNLHIKIENFSRKQIFGWSRNECKEVYGCPVIYCVLKNEDFDKLINFDINKLKSYYGGSIRKYNNGILIPNFISKNFGNEYKDINLVISKKEFEDLQGRLKGFKKDKEQQ